MPATDQANLSHILLDILVILCTRTYVHAFGGGGGKRHNNSTKLRFCVYFVIRLLADFLRTYIHFLSYLMAKLCFERTRQEYIEGIRRSGRRGAGLHQLFTLNSENSL